MESLGNWSDQFIYFEQNVMLQKREMGSDLHQAQLFLNLSAPYLKHLQYFNKKRAACRENVEIRLFKPLQTGISFVHYMFVIIQLHCRGILTFLVIFHQIERLREMTQINGRECSNHPALLTQTCFIFNGTYFDTPLNNKKAWEGLSVVTNMTSEYLMKGHVVMTAEMSKC